MKFRTCVTILLSLVLLGTALAQPLGFGAARQGSVLYASGSAIAKLASKYEDIDLRMRSHRSTTQFIPLVNSGELAFGFANAMELQFAFEGRKIFADRGNPNLRLVSVMYPLLLTLATRADESSVQTLSDLKGLRVPGEYRGAPVGRILVDAMLANGGLTSDDVNIVPISSFHDGTEAFASGRADAVLVILGAGFVAEVERRAGRLRALSMEDNEPAVAAMRTHIPVASLTRVEPSSRFIGIDRPMNVMTYNLYVFTHDGVAEETVYKVARVLYERQEELARIARVFNGFKPERMAQEIGVPYHPGALRLFLEKKLKMH